MCPLGASAVSRVWGVGSAADPPPASAFLWGGWRGPEGPLVLLGVSLGASFWGQEEGTRSFLGLKPRPLGAQQSEGLPLLPRSPRAWLESDLSGRAGSPGGLLMSFPSRGDGRGTKGEAAGSPKWTAVEGTALTAALLCPVFQDLVTMVEQLARFLGVSCDKAQLESLSEHCHQLVDQCCNAEALPVGRGTCPASLLGSPFPSAIALGLWAVYSSALLPAPSALPGEYPASALWWCGLGEQLGAEPAGVWPMSRAAVQEGLLGAEARGFQTGSSQGWRPGPSAAPGWASQPPSGWRRPESRGGNSQGRRPCLPSLTQGTLTHSVSSGYRWRR